MMENYGKGEPVNIYPPVIEILMWHCHGMTCGECGHQFAEKCTFRNIIGEHAKLGNYCVLPSPN